eukprot:TRINITY_DN103095_c0_g1_i1.p1 TRINITY_DN103095_c0_g1~~TRINITY_DN103095_c0_g1_i1.p1  ORF type:complete len:410 (-),score=36.00 TRINITY_DN103095_c0_g1_i1:71-1300(-)
MEISSNNMVDIWGCASVFDAWRGGTRKYDGSLDQIWDVRPSATMQRTNSATTQLSDTESSPGGSEQDLLDISSDSSLELSRSISTSDLISEMSLLTNPPLPPTVARPLALPLPTVPVLREDCTQSVPPPPVLPNLLSSLSPASNRNNTQTPSDDTYYGIISKWGHHAQSTKSKALVTLYSPGSLLPTVGPLQITNTLQLKHHDFVKCKYNPHRPAGKQISAIKLVPRAEIEVNLQRVVGVIHHISPQGNAFFRWRHGTLVFGVDDTDGDWAVNDVVSAIAMPMKGNDKNDYYAVAAQKVSVLSHGLSWYKGTITDVHPTGDIQLRATQLSVAGGSPKKAQPNKKVREFYLSKESMLGACAFLKGKEGQTVWFCLHPDGSILRISKTKLLPRFNPKVGASLTNHSLGEEF